jgi:hypothetical protein
VGTRLITGMPLVGGWLAASDTALLVALVMFKIGLVVLALPIIYVTAAFLVAAVALPLMAERVAAQDYADIARRGGGSQVGSVWNALTSVLQFLVLLVLSLPLWLIPGRRADHFAAAHRLAQPARLPLRRADGPRRQVRDEGPARAHSPADCSGWPAGGGDGPCAADQPVCAGALGAGLCALPAVGAARERGRTTTSSR